MHDFAKEEEGKGRHDEGDEVGHIVYQTVITRGFHFGEGPLKLDLTSSIFYDVYRQVLNLITWRYLSLVLGGRR